MIGSPFIWKVMKLYFVSLNSARSPVFSHLSITLQGLTTIRALKKEATMLNLFHKHHNEHSQVRVMKQQGDMSLNFHAR